MMKNIEVVIREMTIHDAKDVTSLSSQLGYPLSLAQIEKNIFAVISNSDHCAFVAMINNQVVGWIGVSHSIQIEVEEYTEIHGLVIDKNYRKAGIGKKLIEKAKEWAKEKGDSKLNLHCNIIRTETHKFYEHLGFKEIKQQKVYSIDI